MLPLILLFALGCSESPSGGGGIYNAIAGTYAGPVSGTVNGSAMTGTFTITLKQTAGSLSGSYTYEANLQGGVAAMNGTVSGTLSEGDYPTLTLDLENGNCANVKVRVTGTYDAGVQRLTVTGGFDVVNTVNNACTISSRLSATAVLQR
ncbi:MAG: hypothetical protein KA267_08755 [Gemmatimonadales bacterium]|nr:hypothetical protein [Gemmatimonadales bacterium]